MTLPSADMASSINIEAHEVDVRAHALCLDTSPYRRHSSAATNITRQNWYQQSVALFSIPGLYSSIISEIDVCRGEQRVEAFPFATDNLDIFHIAAWLNDHGIGASDLEESGPPNCTCMFNETHMDETGWPTFPCTFLSVVNKRPDIHTPRTTFRYPLPVSAPPRLWYTITKNHAIVLRHISGAPLFPPLTLADDECDNVTMHDAPS